MPSRAKKRKFQGNKHTADDVTLDTSASARKIAAKTTDFEVNVDPFLQYCIVNFLLFMSLQDILICKKCKGDIKFFKRAEKGLGFQLVVQCRCESDVHIPSSPQINTSYEINRRFVFAMRLIGVGFQAMTNFCGFMDIRQEISKRSYYKLLEHISIATDAVTKLVLQKAAAEEQKRNEAAGNVKNHLTVSGDGS